MSIVVAVLAGLAVFAVVASIRHRTLEERIEPYLAEVGDTTTRPGRDRSISWESVGWGVSGAMVGALLAQGDLFLPGRGRSLAALTGLGAVGGIVLRSMRRSTRREKRIERLRHELPVVADSLAMAVVSGESIAAAVRGWAAGSSGVMSGRFRGVIDDAVDVGMEAALSGATSAALHPDERRLYETLAHSHAFGGRVAESLTSLAKDYRAVLERDITEQGGRKAVTVYGPVLILMVPTALMFLLYPTMVGLRSLGGSP